MGMHRCVQVGEMVKVEKRINKLMQQKGAPASHMFHVVPMQYQPNYESDQTAEDALKEALPPVPYPVVIKVGTAHAGYGKIRMTNGEDMKDFESIMKMGREFYTTEPLVDFAYEYRVQKIGSHYRCFKRNSDTCWKGNWGNLQFEDYKCEDYHKLWVDECAKMFGGIDITGIDILHKKDGTIVALEMNDTACGLMYDHEVEDTQHLRDLVVQRMNEEFCSELPGDVQPTGSVPAKDQAGKA